LQWLKAGSREGDLASGESVQFRKIQVISREMRYRGEIRRNSDFYFEIGGIVGGTKCERQLLKYWQSMDSGARPWETRSYFRDFLAV
jgi:hypothetical protein